jgi:hypothetical protein
MELRHLRYFVAVAEAGSLTVAAEKTLHTTPLILLSGLATSRAYSTKSRATAPMVRFFSVKIPIGTFGGLTSTGRASTWR